MTLTKDLMLGLALASMPGLAHAQNQAPAAPVAMLATAAPANAAPIDPARLAAARKAVDLLFPPGTYAKLIGGSLGTVTSRMMDRMYAMPLADLAGISGKSPEELNKLGKASLAQVMEILDPAFHERQRRTMQAVMAGLGEIMGELEPSIRDGMTEAYARRFDLTQINDLNRFFATPSGQVYAANQMLIGTDPAVMDKMQQLMPVLMQRMPGIMQKAQAATADLPKPRKAEDLSPEQKAQLQTLLGEPAHTPANKK
jgi:hypothetical protein